MSGPGSPWADPNTPAEPGPPFAEPGAPYAGPPPTTAPAGMPPPYGYAQPYGYPQPPLGYPQPYGGVAGQPWGTPYALAGPRPRQRPGQVVTAAVLAFAQAAVVLFASLYVWFFASIADVASAEFDGSAPGTVEALATEGSALAVVQVVSVALLIAAGVWVLNSRRRGAGLLLVVALAVQVVLAAYWLVRLQAEFGGSETDGTFVGLALFFAAGPLVGLGMLLVGPGRRWFDGPAPATRQG